MPSKRVDEFKQHLKSATTHLSWCFDAPSRQGRTSEEILDQFQFGKKWVQICMYPILHTILSNARINPADRRRAALMAHEFEVLLRMNEKAYRSSLPVETPSSSSTA